MERIKKARAGLLAEQPGARGYRAYQFGCMLAACAVLTVFCLLLSYSGYDPAIFWGYFEAPLIPLCNLAIAFTLCLLFFALTGRAWAAFLLTSILCLGVALGNYYLIVIRTDPLEFQDITSLREALAITQKQHYELEINWRIVVSVLGCVGLTAALGFLARWRLRLGWERLIVGLTAAVMAVGCLLGTSSSALFQATRHYDHINTWSTTQIYVSRGVLFSFLRSASTGAGSKPEDYDAAQMRALLEERTEEAIPESRKVDVFVIMRESYADLSDMDASADIIDWSCYDGYHALAEESAVVGDLVTNGFGGNTKNAERCFLTGSYVLKDWRKPANSYVWFLRQQGYETTGLHPFNGWFYNRQNINRYLGFRSYLFREDCFDALVGEDVVADDDVLYEELWRQYQQREDPDKPYFNFTVTYEGHGPYAYTYNQYPERYVKQKAETHDGYAMNNYLCGVEHRDRALLALVDRFRTCERPIVLLTFGDHKPTLGSDINNYTTSAYEACGFDMDLSSEQGFLDYYTTEYLIWMNDAAKEVLGVSGGTETGPMISPCYLMNVLFDALDWGKGPAYLQCMDEFMEQFPVVSTNGRISVNGKLEQTVSGQAAEDYRRLQCLSYYWRENFLYEDQVQ